MFFSVLRMSYDESWNTICHKNGSNNGKSFNILIECNLNFCSISLIINKLMLSFVSNEDNWLTVMVLLQNFFLHYSHEGFEFSLFTTNSSIDDKCSRTKKIHMYVNRLWGSYNFYVKLLIKISEEIHFQL